jgi:hypothetical protein
MKLVTTASAIGRIGWRKIYRRGFGAGALTLFLGPLLGGVTFGVIGVVNHFIMAAKGHVSGPSMAWADELLFVFLWPTATAFGALLVPAAWLAAAIAAPYVAIRVGATGRMTWAETVFLAIACSLLACFTYQKDSSSAGLSSALVFLVCGLCAALALRYLAGRGRRSALAAFRSKQRSQ